MAYRIAVTDDDSSNLKVAEKILSANGYEVSCLRSGEELLEYVKSNTPDLILLDVHMEGIDGFETMQRLSVSKESRSIPVIFLTADDDADTETKALIAGAMDFVVKPFVSSVLLMRVKHTIELIKLQTDLKAEVKRRTEEALEEHKKNERLSLQVVRTLAGTIDAKDSYTKGHSSRVAEYSREIAARAGYSPKAQEEFYMMGLLHDVGKIGIPNSLINKISKLTDQEYDIIKTHPVKGYEILKNITEMPKLAVGARWHHERYDGTGYPDGLKGNDIPEEARIIAVADAYDAMSSKRSYHNIYAQRYIIEEFQKGRGTQFDPRFADIMLEMIDEDKDYVRKEQITEPETEDKNVPVESESEKVFSFLSMLEVGGIDTALGMKYCLNDVEFYKEMLNGFVQDADGRIHNLEESFDPLDAEKYRIHVHSLKSAAKTIGADKLSELAKTLEDAAKENRFDYILEKHWLLVERLRSTVSGVLMATSLLD